jgi:hypothetical protein
MPYPPMRTICRVMLSAILVGMCAVASAADVKRGGDQHKARTLIDQYTAEIKQLAAWCEERGLEEQQKQTLRWLGPRDPYKMFVYVPPKEIGDNKPPADASDDVLQWHARLTRLRTQHANELFVLSKRAVRAKQSSLAFDLVLVAIRANPDHEAIRRLLGYQKYNGSWRSTWEVRKLRGGNVWHEKFGWLPKSHVARYQLGERKYKGRWITAEEDARRHRDIRSGWDVKTEHYTIRTNHEIEAAVQLGVKLERLFRVWQQLFVRYYATEAQVTAMFDGRARVRQVPPHFDVVYFRNRDDYNRSLRASMPSIGKSIGVYVQQTKRAYFFAGKGYDERTLYHEATHQLFHQSRPVVANVGSRANFWIVEGASLLMESLRREDGYDVLGGLDDVRMYAARYRFLEDKFYVPLEEFAGYGMQKFQSDQRVATLYSQAAGVTNFLVFYEGGRYRDALVAYLRTIYSGRDNGASLSRQTGQTFDELDKQYRKFIEATRP